VVSRQLTDGCQERFSLVGSKGKVFEQGILAAPDSITKNDSPALELFIPDIFFARYKLTAIKPFLIQPALPGQPISVTG